MPLPTNSWGGSTSSGRPLRTTRPRCITRTWSQADSKAGLWEITIAVWSTANVFRVATNSCSPSRSKLEDGSSRNMIGGSPSRARVIEIRWRSPPRQGAAGLADVCGVAVRIIDDKVV